MLNKSVDFIFYHRICIFVKNIYNKEDSMTAQDLITPMHSGSLIPTNILIQIVNPYYEGPVLSSKLNFIMVYIRSWNMVINKLTILHFLAQILNFERLCVYQFSLMPLILKLIFFFCAYHNVLIDQNRNIFYFSWFLDEFEPILSTFLILNHKILQILGNKAKKNNQFILSTQSFKYLFSADFPSVHSPLNNSFPFLAKTIPQPCGSPPCHFPSYYRYPSFEQLFPFPCLNPSFHYPSYLPANITLQIPYPSLSPYSLMLPSQVEPVFIVRTMQHLPPIFSQVIPDG